jgi:hypothetical protein
VTDALDRLRLDVDNERKASRLLRSLPDIQHDVNVDISLAEPRRIETAPTCRSSSVNVESPYYGSAFCFRDWCYSVLVLELRCHPPESII